MKKRKFSLIGQIMGEMVVRPDLQESDVISAVREDWEGQKSGLAVWMGRAGAGDLYRSRSWVVVCTSGRRQSLRQRAAIAQAEGKEVTP